MQALKRAAIRLLRFPGPTLNTASSRNMKALGARLAGSGRDGRLRVLNVGGGGRALPANHVGRGVVDAVIYLDIRRTPLVGVVGDALALPFADDSMDAALSLAVLEHVNDPGLSVAEMRRVLKPNGLVYCEIPFLQAYHAAPHDYTRFTNSGIRRLFRDFDEVDLGVCTGPSSALSWILRRYLAGLLTGFSNNRRAVFVAEFLAAWLTFPIKYLDYLFAGRPGAAEIASAFYFLGKKK